MFEAINLEFDYHDQPLLKGIHFSIKPGELLHLRGPNGSGKTTLLRLLAGLLEPLSGDIHFQDQSIYDDLSAYQQRLCFVGHRSGIHPVLTVKENLIFDLKYRPQEQSIDHLLELMGLREQGDQLCEHLSAGQRRRVSLLRLFMSKSALWLLDEPLVALDQDTVSRLMTAIEQHRQQGGMVLMTSHQTLPINAGRFKEYSL